MPRSRADIEAQPKDTEAFACRLREELAEHQPDRIALPTIFGETISAYVHRRHRSVYVRVGDSPTKGLNYDDAARFRDWLNYHFPKETI